MTESPRSPKKIHGFDQEDLLSKPKGDLLELPVNANRLQSHILPALRDRTKSLLLALETSILEKKNPEEVRRIFDAGFNPLNEALNQFCSWLLGPDPAELTNDRSRPPTLPSSPSPSPEYPLIHLTVFKYQMLLPKLKSIMKDTSSFIDACFVLVAQIESPNNPAFEQSTENQTTDEPSKWEKRVKKKATSSLEWIEELISWLSRSELELVQEEWHAVALLTGFELKQMHTIITNSEAAAPSSDISIDENHEEILIHQKVIEPAKSMLTIYKLMRLFFHKLSQTKINYKQTSMMFSAMSMDNLFELSGIIQSVVEDMVHLADAFVMVVADDNPMNESFLEPIESLLECFQACFSIILPHLDSLPSSHSVDKLDNLKTWFRSWDRLFVLATQKFIQSLYLSSLTYQAESLDI